MTDMIVNVWRCPNCGRQVLLKGDDLEYGDLMCDACETLMELAGHQDITVED